MDIIYVDNHLLVVNKEGGVPTQESSGDSANVTDWAKRWIKQKYGKAGAVFLEPIHRLDKPVTGLVLFARTSKALCRLQEMMRERKIGKWYYALVGVPPCPPEGTLEHFLIHDAHRARVVSPTHPEGKRAILTYRTQECSSQGVLLEIELKTGRYHQIRVQLATIGCPVIGDRKYGSPISWHRDRIALHHGKMSFDHPVKREEMTLTAPLPFLLSSL